MKIKFIRQREEMDCGPTCLKIICNYYGINPSIQYLRDQCDKSQQGVTLQGINVTAEDLGFRTIPLRLGIDDFMEQAQLPCIIHWQNSHYVVVYKIHKDKVYMADPAKGKIIISRNDFKEFWCKNDDAGVVLFLQPTEKVYQYEEEIQSTNGLYHILLHFSRFKKFFFQLGIGAMLVSLTNLTLPFLTQALVDHGIGNKDIDFLYIILIGQIFLFISKTSVEFIRGWLLMHMGTRINIAIVSEFLMKLMRLPLSYFARSNLGDVLQRIMDHHKIEEFLTSHSLTTIFSLINLVLFSIIMATYSVHIFLIFFFSSLLSIYWVTLFLNKRKVLDYREFKQLSDNQNAIVEIVSAMPEIKLNNCASSYRWQWEKIQAKLYKTRIKGLALDQYQLAGNLFINEMKNIIITFWAAYLVIEGEITLGMMMAITYILAQMNTPIENLINFIKMGQDAKLSMERLMEVQQLKDEKDEVETQLSESVPPGDLKINNLTFKYSKHDKQAVLNKFNLIIPHKKTTAIVGTSGSGKTTLLKLLLKFYQPDDGSISLNGQNIKFICSDYWRGLCGVVMQDGHIFSNSIAKNIALSNDSLNMSKVISAAKTANIHNEIENLPQGYFTPIGVEGVGLSGGQIQRILIARAVYKDPHYIFLDEATSALDAKNEKKIQNNLTGFLKGKTVLVIAHRLSTVKNADQIIVMEKGNVVEQGTHEELTQLKGHYYDLVKNQLELGN